MNQFSKEIRLTYIFIVPQTCAKFSKEMMFTFIWIVP